MSQALTRRSVVRAAPVTVVAASIPLLAAAATATGPDGELLSLAKEFDRLHQEWKDLDVAAAQLEPPTSDAEPMEEFWRHRRESGYEDAVTRLWRKFAEIDSVADRMRELPPQTLQGLAAKARLAQYDVHLSSPLGMEGPEREWDWNVLCMEHFVRDIERFASIYAGGLHA